MKKINSYSPKSHKPTKQPNKQGRIWDSEVFNQNNIVTSFILLVTEKELLSKKILMGQEILFRKHFPSFLFLCYILHFPEFLKKKKKVKFSGNFIYKLFFFEIWK